MNLAPLPKIKPCVCVCHMCCCEVDYPKSCLVFVCSICNSDLFDCVVGCGYGLFCVAKTGSKISLEKTGQEQLKVEMQHWIPKIAKYYKLRLKTNSVRLVLRTKVLCCREFVGVAFFKKIKPEKRGQVNAKKCQNLPKFSKIVK